MSDSDDIIKKLEKIHSNCVLSLNSVKSIYNKFFFNVNNNVNKNEIIDDLTSISDNLIECQKFCEPILKNYLVIPKNPNFDLPILLTSELDSNINYKEKKILEKYSYKKNDNSMDVEYNDKKNINDIKKNINLLSENLIKFINQNKNYKKFNSDDNKNNNNNNNYFIYNKESNEYEYYNKKYLQSLNNNEKTDEKMKKCEKCYCIILGNIPKTCPNCLKLRFKNLREKL